jgi:hypothetical protein
MSRDLQMFFAAVTHLVDVTGGKVSNLFSGHMETNNIHKRTRVNFVLENVNEK